MSAGLDIIILDYCIIVEGNGIDNLCLPSIYEWHLTNHQASDVQLQLYFM
jgi:hypothetical protein